MGENVRDSAPDDQRKDSTAQNNDDKGHQEEKPRDQNASNDNQGHDDSNVSDNTQTNTDAQSQNTDGAQTTETNAASGDKVTDEAATNALAQSTAAAAQTATDPAIVAMADPKKGTLVDQTVKTTTQGTQAVDANGTNIRTCSHKDGSPVAIKIKPDKTNKLKHKLRNKIKMQMPINKPQMQIWLAKPTQKHKSKLLICPKNWVQVNV